MSRTRAKRYLGMTVPQLGSLGILFLCIGCLFIGGYWWLNSMVAAAYAVPESNFTPAPSATPLPSETPLPTPSPTPITYESRIPAGWKQFKPEAAPGMEIWFPESYVLQTGENKTIQILGGEEDEDIINTILLLEDTTPSPYLIITTFKLAARSIFGSDLDKMINDQFALLMSAGRLIERDPFVFETEAYPARRLIFDINVGGVDAGLAIYVVQVDVKLYFLGFASPFNELYTRLPDFDRIAQTFRIVMP